MGPGAKQRLPTASARCCARAASAGFSLIDVIVAAVIVLLTALMGVAYVTRSAQEADWSRDRSFARQKALSILAELESAVHRDGGVDAATLDAFDDGSSVLPNLTIAEDPAAPGMLMAPESPISANVYESGAWRWGRQIDVRPFGSQAMRDLRVVSVRMFRSTAGQPAPGTRIAEVSAVIRTVGSGFAPTQVYDVYLLALENVPGWWVPLDTLRSLVEAALTDIESRNRGVRFRTHWITRLGYGRDEQYAPYTNEERTSTEATPWTYVYPGRMPAGEASLRYYAPGRIRARVNVDGVGTPAFENEGCQPEAFTDDNGNGTWEPGEPFVDADGDGSWSPGNCEPYALADMHNHCMRYPEALARFEARVAAGSETEDTPTWRLLLDRMISEPDRYRNAIVVNLHGELLPLPPVRNVSDPAKDPQTRPGWRVVTQPERLRPTRVAGSTPQSEAPRFRVYAYKAGAPDSEDVTTQREPLQDTDGDGEHDAGESFTDWNGNGVWDAGLPISIVLRGGDFSTAPNAATNPSLRVLRLPGGVDADADGSPDPYRTWEQAPQLPEALSDTNGDGIRQVAEPWLDMDGNGSKDPGEPHQELDGDGQWSAAAETFLDGNANGRYDRDQPAEAWTDTNGNGSWDAAEPFLDVDGDGAWSAPGSPPSAWVPWNPSGGMTLSSYVTTYGEPFLDLNGDKTWSAAEPLTDLNGNGVHDGGYARGEMWFEVEHDPVADRTVVRLHATPLRAPPESGTNRGLPEDFELYGMAYVPCPTPDSASATNRFARDLYTAGVFPKNTARWIVELPVPALRHALESTPGANDGDAEDRLIVLETRLGRDLTTGAPWHATNAPPNLSTTYAYWYADAASVPFSERYQFQGDPRHSPYADTDATGATAPHGYNWYFDDLNDGALDASPKWKAFDGDRLRDGWLARGGGHDVPRLLAWLRTAITRSGAVFTSLSGQSFCYLSLGGDVGGDSTLGYPNGVPVSGQPFGQAGSVQENTFLADAGTAGIGGSVKYVRSNDGGSSGYWWSKPWLGELFPDSAYATQWLPCGNLVASTDAADYRLIRRGAVTTAQQPPGTRLADRTSRLGPEGCTSFFNIGSTTATFHHQVTSGQSGSLVEDGPELAANYGFALPATAAIGRPFGVATQGGLGEEFDYTNEHPRFSGQLLRRFYDHANGQTGSGIVRLQTPGASPDGGFVLVGGPDSTLGADVTARYELLATLHTFFAAGAAGTPNRVAQVPRVVIQSPTCVTELENPETVEVRWSSAWRRWDGKPYTELHGDASADTWSDIVYVLLYSADGGETWRNMRDGSAAEPGTLPRLPSGDVDTARTLADLSPGSDETWTWPTPAAGFPEGDYLVRIEAHRATNPLHYAHHMERIHVDR